MSLTIPLVSSVSFNKDSMSFHVFVADYIAQSMVLYAVLSGIVGLSVVFFVCGVIGIFF